MTEGDLKLQVEYAGRAYDLAMDNLLRSHRLVVSSKRDLPMMHPSDISSDSINRCPACKWRLLISFNLTWCESEYCDYAERLSNEEG